MTNAYIVWRAVNMRNRKWAGTHEEFMLSIHQYLIMQDVDLEFLDNAPPKLVEQDHESANCKDQEWHSCQPRCQVCYLHQNEVTRTWNYCVSCQIPLCPPRSGRNCFETWHNPVAMERITTAHAAWKKAQRGQAKKRSFQSPPSKER